MLCLRIAPPSIAPTIAPTPTQPGSPPAALGDISGSLLTYRMPDDYLRLNDVYDLDSYGTKVVYVDLHGIGGSDRGVLSQPDAYGTSARVKRGRRRLRRRPLRELSSIPFSRSAADCQEPGNENRPPAFGSA